MNELDTFLDVMLPRLKTADTALHNGDATERVATWSRNDPVTLFGAAFCGSGWAQIEPLFRALGAQFSNRTSWEFELLAAGASVDLAYLVGIEHTTASVAGAPAAPTRCALRRSSDARTMSGRSCTATAIRMTPRQNKSLLS